ncbi:MAG: SgcJ/EcaC family oxidoreductase [Patescibacteria group bacterium]
MSKELETREGKEILEGIAKQNFKTWSESLTTKDPKAVAELYTSDATFLPTVSGEFKKGQEGAKEYFHHFLEKDPRGEVTEEEVQSLGENCYLHSGMYNFEVNSSEGGRQIVEARFSFVWRKNEKGEWKILHHHSSVKPK